MHANDMIDQRYDFDVIDRGRAVRAHHRRPSPDRGARPRGREASGSLDLSQGHGYPSTQHGDPAQLGAGSRDPPSFAAQSIGNGDLADPRRARSGCRARSAHRRGCRGRHPHPARHLVAKINSSRCCMIICAPEVGRSGSAPKWLGSARPTTPSASLHPREGQSSYQVTAQYLVGADGGRSQVGGGRHRIRAAGPGRQSPCGLVRCRSVGRACGPALRLECGGGSGCGGHVRNDRAGHALDLRHGMASRGREQLGDWTPERIIARLRAASGLPDPNPEIIGSSRGTSAQA